MDRPRSTAGHDRWTSIPAVAPTSTEDARTTLIVTTYNRPAYVTRLLGYLSQRRFAARLLLVDASEEEVQATNRTELERRFPSAVFLSLPTSTSLVATYKAALHAVDTEFVAYCPDDDFLDPDFIAEGECFLREHREYVLCSGRFTMASRNERTAFFNLQANASVEHDDPLDRFCHLVANYWPTLRSVQRTDVAIDAATTLDAYHHHSVLGEALHGSVYALYGKIKVLDRIGQIQFEHDSRNQRIDPSAQTLLCSAAFQRCLRVFQSCVQARLRGRRDEAHSAQIETRVRDAVLRHLANNYWLWRDGAVAQLHLQFPTLSEDRANELLAWLEEALQRDLLPELRSVPSPQDGLLYENMFKVLHFSAYLQVGDNGRRWRQSADEMDGMDPSAWEAFREKWRLARRATETQNDAIRSALRSALLSPSFVDRYVTFRRSCLDEARRLLRKDLADDRLAALLDCLTVISLLETIGRIGGHDYTLVRDVVSALNEPDTGAQAALEEAAYWIRQYPSPRGELEDSISPAPRQTAPKVTPAADSPAARWRSGILPTAAA